MKRAVSGALAGGALGLLWLGQAQAYVRSTTKMNVPTAWGSSNVSVHLYMGNPPPFLDRATLGRAASASAAVWSKAAVGCTELTLTLLEREEADLAAEYDMVNRIGFRREEWRKMPCDPSKEMCVGYNPAAIAITTVTSNTRTGEILDADMEINAVENRFADVAVSGAKHADVAQLQDLQNTLTHEFGHLIGLDHNCYDPLANTRGVPLDDKGNKAVNCNGADTVTASATMYSKAFPREISKRDLAEDDLKAVCGVYPLGYRGIANLGDDEPGGCSFTPAAPTSRTPILPGVALAAAFATVLFSVRRRR